MKKMNLTSELLQSLENSGIEDKLKNRTLEFLEANSPKKYARGWEVEVEKTVSGVTLSVLHETLNPDSVAMFEYGLAADDVAYATMRKLEEMVNEEFPDMILEALIDARLQ